MRKRKLKTKNSNSACKMQNAKFKVLKTGNAPLSVASFQHFELIISETLKLAYIKAQIDSIVFLSRSHCCYYNNQLRYTLQKNPSKPPKTQDKIEFRFFFHFSLLTWATYLVPNRVILFGENISFDKINKNRKKVKLILKSGSKTRQRKTRKNSNCNVYTFTI